VFAAVLVLALAVPGAACGSGGWAWPVDGSAGLHYGQSYVDATGRTCTHGGLDITAAAGSTVHSCAAGEVTFAGLVPGGVGVRVWAVSVLMADGLKFTVMPLSSAAVSSHAHVAAGDDLGSLAAAGDASAPGTHLHLSVKRGGAALDPLAFLAQPDQAAAPAAPVAIEPPAAGGASGTRVHGATHAPSAVPNASSAPANSYSGVGAPGTAADPAAVLHGALDSLGNATPLVRVEQVASPAVLDPKRAEADLSRARGQLVRLAAVVIAGLLAIGGVSAVMRSARAAGQTAAPTEARRVRA